MFATKLLEGRDDIRDALEIRKSVFVEEQGVSESVERDKYDKLSRHVVIYEDGKALATGRLVYKDNQHTIGRVAVLKEHRGRKLGALVVNVLVEHAFKNGVSEVHIHAQKQVREFYEKLGFQAYGDIFLEAGIEHICMLIKSN